MINESNRIDTMSSKKSLATPSTKMFEESKEQDGVDNNDDDDLDQHVRILNTMNDIDLYQDEEESLPFEMIGKHNTESAIGPNIDQMIKMTDDEDTAARQ